MLITVTFTMNQRGTSNNAFKKLNESSVDQLNSIFGVNITEISTEQPFVAASPPPPSKPPSPPPSPPPPSPPPPSPPPIPPPQSPSAESLALLSQYRLNEDTATELARLQTDLSLVGLIVELNISGGTFDGDADVLPPGGPFAKWGDRFRPLLFFNTNVSVISEVKITGKSSKANPDITQPAGTIFRQLPLVVHGYGGNPVVTLQRMRFTGNTVDEPALSITGDAVVVIRDCVFEGNAGSAIRMTSGRLEIKGSQFIANGNVNASGGALQLLGGTIDIYGSVLTENVAYRGAAIFIQTALVTLGYRTLLIANNATGSGNSLAVAKGKIHYVLPAPLGRWVGPVLQDLVSDSNYAGSNHKPWSESTTRWDWTGPMNGRTTYGITIFEDYPIIWDPVMAHTFMPVGFVELSPLVTIDEDFPFACEAGYFREDDAPQNQDGPRCEAICRPGGYCPPATASPYPCFHGTYCPEGSAWPISCPNGTFTELTNLTAPEECSPCALGHYCPLNTTYPIPCGIGQYAPIEGHGECILCPVGYFQDELGQSTCKQCIDGVYCALGTTIEPCAPGKYRDLETGICINAPIGHFASLGSTEPSVSVPRRPS